MADMNTVGIIGAGQMGCGIAHVFALSGARVLLNDISQDRIEAGIATIKRVGLGNIKLMFDCYHTQIMQGDVIRRIETNLDFIGHVQIAAVPDRGEPDHGELCYQDILLALDAAGYEGYIGAEYRPAASTEAGLGWLANARGWQ